MSALPPKADINAHRLECLLLAKSGHWDPSEMRLSKMVQLDLPPDCRQVHEKGENLGSRLAGQGLDVDHQITQLLPRSHTFLSDS